MSDTIHQKNARNAWFDGRIEKRQSMSVPVYLTPMTGLHSRERTTTENVSPHGARAISNRPWRPGEEALIAPRMSAFPRVGRVIYCEARTEGCFCVGLEFRDRAVKW
jgi:hypothetical protein